MWSCGLTLLKKLKLKVRNSSRYGSSSRRAVAASRHASSSGEPSDIQQNRLVSGGGHMSTTQRIQLAFEARTSSRAASVRRSRDDDHPLRSMSCSRLGNNEVCRLMLLRSSNVTVYN
ncbi:hypothetical protein QQP08_021180 [Theobroma cacao]|nr:hypothetical protein QQP08_021180 [Theobroma cacao]